MGFYGADTQQLRDLATTLNKEADRLDLEVVKVVSWTLFSSPWDGADAIEFRARWSRQIVPALGAASQALRTAASDISRNADEQEKTSDAASGSVGGGIRPWDSESNAGSKVEIADREGQPTDEDLFQQVLSYMGSTIDDLETFARPATDLLSLGSMLDAIETVSGKVSLADEIPTLGTLTGALGAVTLGVDAFDTMRTWGDESESMNAKIFEGIDLGGSAMQQTSPTNPVFWAGTLMRTGVFIAEQIEEISPWPEGVDVWTTIADEPLSDNPVVAVGQVAGGLIDIAVDSTFKTLGEIF